MLIGACVMALVAMGVVLVSRLSDAQAAPTSSSAPATPAAAVASGEPRRAVDPSEEIARIEREDEPRVSALAGQWVPQISSKRVGLQADGVVYGPEQILADHLRRRAVFPDAVLLSSGRFATYSRPDFAVTVVARPQGAPEGVLAWCAAARLGSGDCYAIRLLTMRDGLPVMVTGR